jgi:hypothetical protein
MRLGRSQVESQIRRASVIPERVYGGECQLWGSYELRKREVAILLFLSQLAQHLCRFDSPPRHVLSLSY